MSELIDEFIPPVVDGRYQSLGDYFPPRLWVNTERSFQRLFVRTLAEQQTPGLYGWPAIISIHTEYKIGGAICDVVAFHVDGSITVFELKRGRLALRDFMTGIGQLIHASVQFGLALAHQATHRTVRLVLAVPSGTEHNVGFACLAAGIEYMPFGTVEEYNQIEREYAERIGVPWQG